MSRRGNATFEEREYFREAPTPPQVRVRERDYEQIDDYRGQGSRPAFLDREEYTRTADALVVRGRDSGPLERRDLRRSNSEVRIREREIVERPRSPQERVRTRIVERRSPSPPPERLRARVVETRERIRERSPSPPPVRIVRERFVERERGRSPSPPQIDRVRIRNVDREIIREPSPSPSPSPPPAIRAPPIHQEIITHHRHIDHGKS